MKRLAGESVLISGGATGLGRAIVERFISEGALVTVVDNSKDKFAEMQNGRRDMLECVSGDVRNIEDMQRAAGQALARFGKIDCAIGNAGLWDYSTPLDNIPTESLSGAFDEIFGVNVKGYLNLAKAALPSLVRSRGSLIFTVSNAGFYPGGGGPLYTASKHAVVGLIHQLAFELAPAVRVNGVAPGPIHTKLRGPRSLGLDTMTIDQLDLPANAAAMMAIGSVPTPEEYAGSYVHFASRSDSIPSTGGILMTDCGIGIRGIGAAAAGHALVEKYI
ncbi:MAG: 3-(cis-5,6-dihydroxycyclohexa-1,3-dien-1-yl)propanoate dehydrogenase [Parvibaculum sp.]|uniref:3-(cis-5,6-dihydroxycyclohexa-1, 3-dien-1-yl)propanoate dehydrogenase n=1 Tax=Parvibaculum sp. TaxID=2024848 RepID=UPI00271FB44F|nr:3-(cis-5,6-dihydroxycyclohexa-1,3-dien-1-yl)propanoate dehydrogenase [Parvibaculum sp.]MDO8839482.1 3-(cis-5,6-dihydroxycyclohexa-1,3-dien-1-yl)propanoate dehydrogenase [Parvibaculum sp.]